MFVFELKRGEKSGAEKPDSGVRNMESVLGGVRERMKAATHALNVPGVCCADEWIEEIRQRRMHTPSPLTV